MGIDNIIHLGLLRIEGKKGTKVLEKISGEISHTNKEYVIID